MNKVLLYIDKNEKYADIHLQKSDLGKEVVKNNWHIVGTFFDKDEKNSLIQQAKDYYIFLDEKNIKPNFDLIMVWDIKIIWENINNFYEMLDWLRIKKIGIYFYNQSISNFDDDGFLYKYAKIFSETEKIIKSERIHLGLSRVRGEGKKLGRPEKKANQIKIIEDRSQGLTIRDIATKHKLSIGKVHYLINTL